MTCEYCGEQVTKLVKFRSAQVCTDCCCELESEEMDYRRGYRPDCAQSRIEEGFYELMEDIDS
jgi:hypothetical protein